MDLKRDNLDRMSQGQQPKEAIFYENYKELVSQSLLLTSVLISFNVYAADQSICRGAVRDC